jgi:predicted lipid-binding transport protein (Tim44 family)
MSSSLIQLIVLAGIAIFLVLRLRNVLGTRDGFEKPTTPAIEKKVATRRDFEVIEGGPDRDIIDHVPDGSASAKALMAMKSVEPDFGVGDFLQGASGAYEMILMAFERGDLDQLTSFLAADVLETFENVVLQRREDGLTIEASFVGVAELVLQEATFDNATNEAEITVKFVGELTFAVKDSSGEVIEGDQSSIKRQRDVWTFGRTMGSADPNWMLVATGG